MKRGTPDHPKTRRLARELRCPHLLAVGILEALWHWVARYAPAGDIGRHSDADIADGIGYGGDATALVGALLAAGWLDRSDAHRVVIHDWHDHADEAVHLALARAGHLFACGARPRMSRMSTAERAACEARYARPVPAVTTPSTPAVPAACTPHALPIHSPPLPSHGPPIPSIGQTAAPETAMDGVDGARPLTVRDALHAAGVRGQWLARLAASPALTVDAVQREAAELAGDAAVRDPVRLLVSRLAEIAGLPVRSSERRQALGALRDRAPEDARKLDALIRLQRGHADQARTLADDVGDVALAARNGHAGGVT